MLIVFEGKLEVRIQNSEFRSYKELWVWVEFTQVLIVLTKKLSRHYSSELTLIYSY